MSVKFVSVRLDVATLTSNAHYVAEFHDGLNVLAAPNTWGKSTLIQSLVYGLGLEGSFSASHLSPLGEAMTSTIELDGRRQAVLQSSVEVVLRNRDGNFLRARRYPKSPQFESHLIATWRANTLGALEEAPQVDMYVREGGAATNELGFHRALEEFLGWELPEVPGFDDRLRKLYLEVLFPLFFIEQKYGWAGLSPRLPTHYKVRNPLRRSVEFVLGLRSLARMKQKELGRLEVARLQATLDATRSRLSDLVELQGWRLTPSANDSDWAISTADGALPIEALDGDWVPLEDAIVRWTKERAAVTGDNLPVAGQRTAEARAELAAAETALVEGTRLLNVLTEEHEAAVSALSDLTRRLSEVRNDRERLIDVKKLQRLGSDLDMPALYHATCPTCMQDLEGRAVATGVVLDVDANISLLDAEKQTLTSLERGERDRVLRSAAARDGLSRTLSERRQAIRLLKDELTGPSGAPSISVLQRRLQVESLLQRGVAVSADAREILEQLAAQSLLLATRREELRTLGSDEDDQHDKALLSIFRREFRSALTRFGLRSLPVDEIDIGAGSLLPEHAGFELTFDIHHGMSASDTIRTKWAYYVALASASADSEEGHPIGFLVVDEPRQQEANLESVRGFYEKLATIAGQTQVVVASSANEQDLSVSLSGLDAWTIRAESARMFTSDSSASV